MKIYQLFFFICLLACKVCYPQTTINNFQSVSAIVNADFSVLHNLKYCTRSDNSNIKQGAGFNVLLPEKAGTYLLQNNTTINYRSFDSDECNVNYKPTTIDTIQEADRRKYYLSFNLGFIEGLGLGFGYQSSDIWSFTGKISFINRDNQFLALNGIGMRIARFITTSLPFNNINVQPTVMLFEKKRYSYLFGIQGYSFEIGIGNESIKKSELNFAWSIGGILSVVKKRRPLYSPSLKLGINWNF